MFDSFDRRIRYLRVSVTDLCDMRCRYCGGVDGVELKSKEDILSFEEIRAFVEVAVGKGVDKVRLTGGEPLVRRGVVSLVEMLAGIPGIKDFAMSTNGSRLREFAESLKEAGLHRLNVSLDTMDSARFAEITGGGDLASVLDGISSAVDAGFERIKLNCVISKSPNESDARSVAEFAERNGFEIRYIREMNFGKGEFWKVIGGDGGDCAACDRLRLSSDGKLYPCLFSDKNYSIRELGYEKALDAAVAGKPESGHESDHKINILGG